ncbi:MAG: AMP-binding protein [Novosphingobium sp.]
MHPRHFASTRPDHPAAIMKTGEICTFGELEAIANRGANLLRALGLKSGDMLALMIDNSLAYFDLFWAAQRSGLFLVPVPTRLTAGEAKYILHNSEARVFVCSAADSDVAQQILADRPDVPGVTEFFAVNGAVPGYRDWYGEIAGLPDTPIAGEEAGSHMAHSSGTTGRPKGLRHPLRGGPADGPSQLDAQWAKAMAYVRPRTISPRRRCTTPRHWYAAHWLSAAPQR